MTPATPVGIGALRAMRTIRRKHRVADLEWFELLYRVYLAALIGGFAVLWLSSLVRDDRISLADHARFLEEGPSIVGLVAACAVWLGMRSGAGGGPVNLEEADVRHVLLSPVDRGSALRRPAVQRLRSAGFAGALVGGACGLVVAKRMPTGLDSSPSVWVLRGCAVGTVIGTSFVSVALLVHATRANRIAVALLGPGLVAAQAWGIAAGAQVPAPLDPLGDLAVGTPGLTTGAVLVVTAALGALALARTGRLSLEAVSRRSSLVSQLRFAVTMQDIRTVIVLRRQLAGETVRSSPWFSVPRPVRTDPVRTRCARSLARFPAVRLVRMSASAALASGCLVAAYRGTTPMLVAGGLVFFVLGLDLIEPLSEEIDRGDRTDTYPLERCDLYARHLLVPAVASAPFVVIGVAVAYTLERHPMTLVAAVLIGVPAVLAGLAGAVISSVRGAPDPTGRADEGLLLPPEVSGMTTVLRAAWPPFVAVTGSLPVVALVETKNAGGNIIGTLVRTSLAVGIMVFCVAGWVRQRDAIHAWFRTMTNPPRETA